MSIDIGCGAGRYTGLLGRPASGSMLQRRCSRCAQQAAPEALLVRATSSRSRSAVDGRRGVGEHELSPRSKEVAPGILGGPSPRALDVGAPLDIQVLHGEFEGTGLPDDRVGGQVLRCLAPTKKLERRSSPARGSTRSRRKSSRTVRVVRTFFGFGRSALRTCADSVGPGMRLLVCGLNPSVYSADAGMGFARPGNRFWPAAPRVGISSLIPRDTRERALEVDRIGMTDW